MGFFKDSFLDFTTVKIYVGGMVPNETRLALIDDSDNKKVIFNELCDEFGEFNYRIKRKYVGKKLRFPIRQSPFKFNHEEKVVIQPWGYFEAIRMEKDYSDANREKCLTRLESLITKIMLLKNTSKHYTNPNF
jgi:hypothetical protein